MLKTWSLACIGNRLFAGTVSGIYYTDNNGVNWAKAILPNNNAAHHIIYSLLIQGNLIIAGSAGHIYYSEDGGNTWQQSELGSLFEVHQLLSLNGHFMAGTSGTGWYFSENGKEWLGHPEFGGQGNIQAAVLVDNELVSAVSLNGVLQENSPMNQGLTDAAFKSLTYHQGKLYGGTYDQGVFRFDVPPNLEGSNLAQSRNSTLKNPAALDFSISPNPASQGPVNLRYSLIESSAVDLQLYDVNGVQLARVLQVNQDAGQYVTTYTTEDLPTGNYYFTLQVNGQSITKQMMIIR